MKLWDTITGNDLTAEWGSFETRVATLPDDYRAAWGDIVAHLFPYGNFTGRNLMPVLDGVLDLLEECASIGQPVLEVVGDDIPGFCAAVAAGRGAQSPRDRWRRRLNSTVARKLGRIEDEAAFRRILEEERAWRAHVARVKELPHDYRVVYRAMQRYLIKVGGLDESGMGVLSEIVEFFEEGAAAGTDVLDLVGNDVAAFCDELVRGTPTADDRSP
jgi:DNA-binding ferritin-like protein (Dps family)